VASPVRHDPGAFRIYATDEDVSEAWLAEDVAAAAAAVWTYEHLNAIDAADSIRQAVEAIQAAGAQLDRAVFQARARKLSWARIGAAAGISAQSAHERWAPRTKGSPSRPRRKQD